MKEYHKLSLEACRKAYGTDTAILDYIGGWQEGFLKAREMASEWIYHNLEDKPWPDEFRDEMKKLGEKEV